ncbi:hypothetical protein PMIN06_007344 [Paraphaeosphaeria minitans]
MSCLPSSLPTGSRRLHTSALHDAVQPPQVASHPLASPFASASDLAGRGPLTREQTLAPADQPRSLHTRRYALHNARVPQTKRLCPDPRWDSATSMRPTSLSACSPWSLPSAGSYSLTTMAPRTRTGTGTGTGTHPRPPTLSNSPSPSPSLPSLLSYPLHDDASAYLSLTDFPTSPHTASPPSTRPSTAPPVESQMASQPCADSFDGIAARWAAEASKRAFARRLHEPGLASHSPTAGDGMVEVSGALRETHDALMRCLYAPGGVEGEMEEDKGDGGEKGEGGYRWSPSGEELERVYGRGKIAAKREEQKRTRSESVAGERTVVQMRGGGVHEFFGLKRKVGEAESVEPGRPAIISRPSDAFDHTGRARVGVVIPGRGFEELRTGASGPQDSRLLRVRQMGRPAPRSLHPNDGRLSSMAGSGKTASIAPEGTIASFYIGDRSHPGTLRASSDLRDSRVSVSDFPSPPPSSAGGYDDGTLAQKSSSTRSDQSGSTIRGVSLSVELPTTEQEQRDNTYREPSIRGPHRKAVDEYSGEGEEGGEPHTVHKLGSPMQSPVRDTVNTRSRCDRSFSTSSTPSYQGGSSPPSSGNVEDPQTTFFAPISPTSLGRSTVGSLRRNRRPFGQSQKAERPLPSVDEQDSKPWLFPPGGALSSDLAPPLHNPTASETTGVDPSDGSVWQGGRHLSVAPEDSHSEVLERKHLQALKAARAPTALRRHHGGKTELQNGEALQEVGESYETEGEAKERTEERFRDEVRRVWSHYQTRMRIINEDTERTPEDKDRVRSHRRCQSTRVR